MKFVGSLLLMVLCFPSFGQVVAESDSSWRNNIRFSAYGVVNYYAYDWETYPDINNAFDPERLNTYLYYDFTDRIELKTEIEFEHGGTGATMEFDPLEEFGEFESAIEKGGQVVVEQLNLSFHLHPAANIRVGKMRFYMGNASRLDEPTEYFTPYRSEPENSILPLGWYETGVEVSGHFPLQTSSTYPGISYYAYLVSGLDNSGFSSANWVRKGYQTRFETINADALATALRIDYRTTDENEIGVALYAGNTTPNRPKEDFTEDAWLLFGDLHATFDVFPFKWRAYAMYGYLQNSEALSIANKNLSNNLNVKRTPIARNAAAAYAEIGVEWLHWVASNSQQQCYVFGRYDFYDSMYDTEGSITDNPRYERQVISGGFNYFPIEQIVLKTSYALRELGSGEQEKTFALGMGFNF